MKRLLSSPYLLSWIGGGPLWTLHTAVASLRMRGALSVGDRQLQRPPATSAILDPYDLALLELVPCRWGDVVERAWPLAEPIAEALLQLGLADSTVVAEIRRDGATRARLDSPLITTELLTGEGKRVRRALQGLLARGPYASVAYPKTPVELLAFAIRGTMRPG